MLGKLKNMFKDKTRENGQPELRTDPRYNLISMPVAKLRFSDDLAMQVADISYGGLGAVEITNADVPKRSLAKLSVLSKAIETEVICVHSSNGIVGFQFVHDAEEIFVFLREILEYLRVGKTQVIDKSWSDNNSEYLTLRSESEFCGLEIAIAEDSEGVKFLNSMCISIKYAKAKCSVNFRNDELTVEVSSGDPYKDALGEKGKRRVNQQIVRAAIIQTMGFRDKEYHELMRIALDQLIAQL